MIASLHWLWAAWPFVALALAIVVGRGIRLADQQDHQS